MKLYYNIENEDKLYSIHYESEYSSFYDMAEYCATDYFYYKGDLNNNNYPMKIFIYDENKILLCGYSIDMRISPIFIASKLDI